MTSGRTMLMVAVAALAATSSSCQPQRCAPGRRSSLTLCIGGGAFAPVVVQPTRAPTRYGYGGWHGFNYYYRNRYGGRFSPVAVQSARVPIRYDYGGLYGTNYYRNKYGGGFSPLAVQSARTPIRYDYGGLYGTNYYRNKYGGGFSPLAVQSARTPIRYDYGGLYGTNYFRNKYGVRPPPVPFTSGAGTYAPARVPYALGHGYGYAAQPTLQPQPYLPQRPQLAPYQPAVRPLIIRPYAGGSQYSPRADIRTFYAGAALLGRGQISGDANHNVQMVCDFARVGVTPATDVLTDVVWQKVGRPVYINTPMSSAATYPNLLKCPSTYVAPRPTNYGFNIAGSKTTLVIKNATPADYGVYRCYATRVSRLDPRRRTPVYMEIYYSPSAVTTGSATG